MVYVTAGARPFKPILTGFEHLPPASLGDFWIDRYEVTNRDFKRFVDAGGYRNPAYWRHTFVKDGKPLTFEQGIALLTDSTGRPGPATWESGSFREGQDDFPVGGVSWYRGRSVCGVRREVAPDRLPLEPRCRSECQRVQSAAQQLRRQRADEGGRERRLNRFGAADMAGNVKEWCWNAPDASRRYTLGGAWDEPLYTFNDPDARPPFDRAANQGFRCVKYASSETLAGPAFGLVPREIRDYNKEKPAADAVFAAYKAMYAYDKTDLKDAVDSVEDGNPQWRRENVSFAAGYGGERIPASVFIPKAGRPPYQAVVIFPGSGAIQMRSSREMDVRRFEWVMKSGRVAIHPVYRNRLNAGTVSNRTFRTSPWPIAITSSPGRRM